MSNVVRKIDLMHRLFGTVPDRYCKECPHLESYRASQKWYKCGVYGNTCSEATDWRLKYKACGMIDIPIYTGIPIVKQVRLLNRKLEEPMEGQLVLDEFIETSIPSKAWVNE